MQWNGVMPAMTTCFKEKLDVDQTFMTRHARWMLDNGYTGIVLLGSLGEAATLTFDEKAAILANGVRSANGRAPIVGAISTLQHELGVGNARVRGPRIEITGEELAKARKTIQQALRTRPSMQRIPFPAAE